MWFGHFSRYLNCEPQVHSPFYLKFKLCQDSEKMILFKNKQMCVVLEKATHRKTTYRSQKRILDLTFI